jgi:acyl-CoA synthetase (AMP-forming)/AMP-acid ligase II
VLRTVFSTEEEAKFFETSSQYISPRTGFLKGGKAGGRKQLMQSKGHLMSTTETIDALIIKQAQATPDSIALSIHESLGAEETVTYRHVVRAARKAAHFLQSANLNIGPESVVAICLDEGKGMVILQLAVLMAGGAFLPLDVRNMPASLLKDSVKQVRPSCVIARDQDVQSTQDLLRSAGLGHLPVFGEKHVLCDAESDGRARHARMTSHGDELGPSRHGAEQHACWIYPTSGSTGMPKWVVAEHRNAVNYMRHHPLFSRARTTKNNRRRSLEMVEPCARQTDGGNEEEIASKRPKRHDPLVRSGLDGSTRDVVQEAKQVMQRAGREQVAEASERKLAEDDSLLAPRDHDNDSGLQDTAEKHMCHMRKDDQDQEETIHRQQARILLCSAFTFDPSAGDAFAALANGHTLCLASRTALLSDLTCILSDMRITHVCSTPPVWSLVRDDTALPYLRVVALGGEEMPRAILQRWADRVTLLNVYGTTECTVYQTSKVMESSEKQACACDTEPRQAADAGADAGQGEGRYPAHSRTELLISDAAHSGNTSAAYSVTADIGMALPNNGIVVVDGRSLLPVPPGSVGMICIYGAQVARGYLNDSELTQERFVILNGGLGRGFVSGDAGVQGLDGSVRCLGRAAGYDWQAKVHGVRVDLRGAESRLMMHAAVQTAFACVDHGGNVRACVLLKAGYVDATELEGARHHAHDCSIVNAGAYQCSSIVKHAQISEHAQVPIHGGNQDVQSHETTMAGGSRRDSAHEKRVCVRMHELLAWCAQGLSAECMPISVHSVRSLPMSRTGKLDRVACLQLVNHIAGLSPTQNLPCLVSSSISALTQNHPNHILENRNESLHPCAEVDEASAWDMAGNNARNALPAKRHRDDAHAARDRGSSHGRKAALRVEGSMTQTRQSTPSCETHVGAPTQAAPASATELGNAIVALWREALGLLHTAAPNAMCMREENGHQHDNSCVRRDEATSSQVGAAVPSRSLSHSAAGKRAQSNSCDEPPKIIIASQGQQNALPNHDPSQNNQNVPAEHDKAIFLAAGGTSASAVALCNRIINLVGRPRRGLKQDVLSCILNKPLADLVMMVQSSAVCSHEQTACMRAEADVYKQDGHMYDSDRVAQDDDAHMVPQNVSERRMGALERDHGAVFTCHGSRADQIVRTHTEQVVTPNVESLESWKTRMETSCGGDAHAQEVYARTASMHCTIETKSKAAARAFDWGKGGWYLNWWAGRGGLHSRESLREPCGDGVCNETGVAIEWGCWC